MAQKVTRWQSSDGSLHMTEAEARKHESKGEFKCPKCHGFGHVQGLPIYKTVINEDAMGHLGIYSGAIYKRVVTGYNQKTCDVCNGAGWTNDKFEPIYHNEIVGYKKGG